MVNQMEWNNEEKKNGRKRENVIKNRYGMKERRNKGGRRLETIEKGRERRKEEENKRMRAKGVKIRERPGIPV